MWRIDYYKKRGSQRCPSQDFIKELEPDQRVKVMKNIHRLAQLGNKAQFPLVRKINDGFYELRTKVKRNQIRLLYFFFRGNTIVITNGYKEQSANALHDPLIKAKEFEKDYTDQHPEGIK